MGSEIERRKSQDEEEKTGKEADNRRLAILEYAQELRVPYVAMAVNTVKVIIRTVFFLNLRW